MAQVSYFETGGFVVHKAYIAESRCKFSVWFNASGNVVDAERIDARNRSLPASDAQKLALKRRYSYFASTKG